MYLQSKETPTDVGQVGESIDFGENTGGSMKDQVIRYQTALVGADKSRVDGAGAGAVSVKSETKPGNTNTETAEGSDDGTPSVVMGDEHRKTCEIRSCNALHKFADGSYIDELIVTTEPAISCLVDKFTARSDEDKSTARNKMDKSTTTSGDVDNSTAGDDTDKLAASGNMDKPYSCDTDKATIDSDGDKPPSNVDAAQTTIIVEPVSGEDKPGATSEPASCGKDDDNNQNASMADSILNESTITTCIDLDKTNASCGVFDLDKPVAGCHGDQSGSSSTGELGADAAKFYGNVDQLAVSGGNVDVNRLGNLESRTDLEGSDVDASSIDESACENKVESDQSSTATCKGSHEIAVAILSDDQNRLSACNSELGSEVGINTAVSGGVDESAIDLGGNKSEVVDGTAYSESVHGDNLPYTGNESDLVPGGSLTVTNINVILQDRLHGEGSSSCFGTVTVFKGTMPGGQANVEAEVNEEAIPTHSGVEMSIEQTSTDDLVTCQLCPAGGESIGDSSLTMSRVRALLQFKPRFPKTPEIDPDDIASLEVVHRADEKENNFILPAFNDNDATTEVASECTKSMNAVDSASSDKLPADTDVTCTALALGPVVDNASVPSDSIQQDPVKTAPTNYPLSVPVVVTVSSQDSNKTLLTELLPSASGHFVSIESVPSVADDGEPGRVTVPLQMKSSLSKEEKPKVEYPRSLLEVLAKLKQKNGGSYKSIVSMSLIYLL